MNIGSFIPPANPPKSTYPKRNEVAVAISETNKDTSEDIKDYVYEKQQKRRKRRGYDRRTKDIKPALDMRASSDRRELQRRPRINISV
ncbi:MAG: hypothetical protein ACI8VC_002484 [Candidatus Endobugula sp.]|jgi:hypothetical protein